jgi:hypothetical protein
VHAIAHAGGLSQYVTTQARENREDRIIEVIDLDIQSNIEDIVSHAPESLDVPDLVRIPVVFSYDDDGVIESVHPSPGFVRDPFVGAKCGSNSSDPLARSQSLASVAGGMYVTSLPPVPAAASLPFRAEGGFMILGEPFVHSSHDGFLGEIRTVGWTPLRLDLLAADGAGFNGGYLGSFDYREGRFYRIERDRLPDGGISERRVALGVSQ